MTTIRRGTAGASAAREHERRSAREQGKKQSVIDADARWREEIRSNHPIAGRIAAALTAKPLVGPESQPTRAWAQGAAGERRVASVVDQIDGVIALHDRRIPGSRANIDHIAVGPAGVFIIDAKAYRGRIERRDGGSLLRTDYRLYVRGRDETRLVEGLANQVEAVFEVLDGGGVSTTLSPMLCFVGADWPLFARPFEIGGVTVLAPKDLPGRVGASGPLAADEVGHLADALARGLRPA